MTTSYTRRRVLRTGALAVAGTTLLGTAAAKNLRSEGDKGFGAVYAEGDLYRTNVVRVLDERPDNEDRIYFLFADETPIVGLLPEDSAQASPFVSEVAPGDRDYNGGRWSHFQAEVIDVDAFAEYVDANGPVADADVLLSLPFVDVADEPGRPDFEGAPPTYFLCPLNGPAKGQGE